MCHLFYHCVDTSSAWVDVQIDINRRTRQTLEKDVFICFNDNEEETDASCVLSVSAATPRPVEGSAAPRSDSGSSQVGQQRAPAVQEIKQHDEKLIRESQQN